MTASASTALIERYYSSFNAADWSGMLACLAPDVIHDINQGARETGLDSFILFLARMQHSYREQLSDIVVMVNADGSRGAAEYVVHGEYLNTDEGLPTARGQRYVLPGGAFFAINDGQISRVSNSYNLEDWLKQVSA
jgi:steroid delta-isomerase-like uncharacterized protein